MHPTEALRQLIENRESPAKTGIGNAQIRTKEYTRDVKTEPAASSAAPLGAARRI